MLSWVELGWVKLSNPGATKVPESSQRRWINYIIIIIVTTSPTPQLLRGVSYRPSCEALKIEVEYPYKEEEEERVECRLRDVVGSQVLRFCLDWTTFQSPITSSEATRRLLSLLARKYCRLATPYRDHLPVEGFEPATFWYGVNSLNHSAIQIS